LTISTGRFIPVPLGKSNFLMQIGKRVYAFMITLLSRQSLQTTSCACLFWSAGLRR